MSRTRTFAAAFAALLFVALVNLSVHAADAAPAAAPAAAAPAAPAAAPAAPAAVPGAGAKPGTVRERASYALGLNVAQLILQQGFDVDAACVARGVQDALSEKPPVLTEAEITEAVQAFQAELQQARLASAETNKKEAADYFAANGKKEGVTTTKSGLQYEVLKPGEGESPKSSDTVKTQYRGTLLNGQEFDSSYKHGQPAEFQVGGVIPGWQEALKLMKPGAKWRLHVPSELAYGMRGSGPKIGPNAALIFEIELLSVEAAPAGAPGIPGAPGAQ